MKNAFDGLISRLDKTEVSFKIGQEKRLKLKTKRRKEWEKMSEMNSQLRQFQRCNMYVIKI